MVKALFLDRDGVINQEVNYLYRKEEVVFVDGIFDVCRFFQKRGLRIFVITNQAGIGRGYYSEQDFKALTEWMVRQFEQNEIEISKVYYCPHHPLDGIAEYKVDCFDRKPNPGMLLRAKAEFGLDLGGSYLIGDRESDIEAGVNAGVGTNVLLVHKQHEPATTRANVVVRDLAELPAVLELK